MTDNEAFAEAKRVIFDAKGSYMLMKIGKDNVKAAYGDDWNKMYDALCGVLMECQAIEKIFMMHVGNKTNVT